MGERTDIIDRIGDEQRQWCEATLQVLRLVALENPIVTANDIWPVVNFPQAPSGGRVLGKVFLEALKRGWIEKNKLGAHWLALDGSEIPVVRSADGVIINRKSLLPTYRSLLAP